jgi:hypothetical protein
MFLGMAAGTFWLTRAKPTFDMWVTSVSVLPEGFSRWGLKHMPPWVFAFLIWGLFLLPIGVDGFYQLLTPYESTNPVRLVTGFFGGIALGVVLLAPIISALAPWDE